MNEMGKRFLWVSAYAIAMAFLEAVAVVYIRGLLHITNDHVSLGPYVRMEIWREAATIVMLVAVGWMAGRRGVERMAYGLFAFGLWDIWYYVWLKVLIDWPETLLDWDTLFLIPLHWWGPVLSPVLIAALICVTTALAVVRMEGGEQLKFTRARMGAVLLGGLLALYVFMSDSLHALLEGRLDWATLRPEPFKWPLFLAALVLMAVPSLRATWPWRRNRTTSPALPLISYRPKLCNGQQSEANEPHSGRAGRGGGMDVVCQGSITGLSAESHLAHNDRRS